MRSRDVNVYSALNRNRTKRCQIDPEQRAADPETGQGVWVCVGGGVSLPPAPPSQPPCILGRQHQYSR